VEQRHELELNQLKNKHDLEMEEIKKDKNLHIQEHSLDMQRLKQDQKESIFELEKQYDQIFLILKFLRKLKSLQNICFLRRKGIREPGYASKTSTNLCTKNISFCNNFDFVYVSTSARNFRIKNLTDMSIK